MFDMLDSDTDITENGTIDVAGDEDDVFRVIAEGESMFAANFDMQQAAMSVLADIQPTIMEAANKTRKSQPWEPVGKVSEITPDFTPLKSLTANQLRTCWIFEPTVDHIEDNKISAGVTVEASKEKLRDEYIAGIGRYFLLVSPK